MKPHYFTLCAFLLLGGVSTSLCAQPDPGSGKPVTLEIKALAIGRGIGDLGVMQAGKKTPFYVPSFGLSQSFHYTGPRELVFVQTQDKGEGKREIPVATATLPADVAKVFLLLTPAALNPGQFTTQVIPALVGGGGESGARVFNLAPRPILMALNGAKHTVPSGTSIRVPLLKGKLSVLVTRTNKQVEDEADLCRETYTVPEGGRLTLLVSNAVATQTAEDEAVMLIPLMEEATAPAAPATP